jgi:hypothetical protein
MHGRISLTLQGTDTKYDWGLPDHVRTGKES